MPKHADGMHYYDDILATVGNTPLVRLNKLAAGLPATVLAKVEAFNPGGSSKDRIGLSMIRAAEAAGQLKPGGTIVECTSGNTGVGLAMAAVVLGYRTVFCMPDKVAKEKIHLLKSYGAEVVVCPTAVPPESPDSYYSVARRIERERPNAFLTNQYDNPANPAAHYRTTGPELWEQTAGKIDVFVTSIGTGGTISGTSRYLKEMNPAIKIIGADPYGSIFKTYKESGHVPEGTPYLVEGIGQNLPVGNADVNIIDEIINITDRESFNFARELSRREGLFVGGSTGTIFAAALKVAKELDETGFVVFIVCDTGEHYLSKFYSDEWMKEKLMLEPQRITASIIADTKNANSPRELISVTPDHLVSDALAMMNERGVTQMPVIEDHRAVGSLRESGVLTKLLADRDLLNAKVADIMDASFPVLGTDATYNEIKSKLQKHPAVLIEDFKRITGIITRGDLLELPRL